MQTDKERAMNNTIAKLGRAITNEATTITISLDNI
jgi:hypothetical protein